MRTDFGAAGHGGFDCNHIYIFSLEHRSITQQSVCYDIIPHKNDPNNATMISNTENSTL